MVRKRLFHFLDKIEQAEPENGFGEIYQKSIHEKFDNLSKDDLINRLLWLQLKDTIVDYENAPDLNAGFNERPARGERPERGERERGPRNGSTRIFINIGTKDGADDDSLVQFITDNTDLEPNMVSRVTVRELSSFFNVPGDAVDFIMDNMGSRKFNGRKVRVEEADRKPMGGGSGGGNYGKPRSGGGDNYRKGGYEKKEYGGERGERGEQQKSTRARKPNTRY